MRDDVVGLHGLVLGPIAILLSPAVHQGGIVELPSGHVNVGDKVDVKEKLFEACIAGLYGIEVVFEFLISGDFIWFHDGLHIVVQGSNMCSRTYKLDEFKKCHEDGRGMEQVGASNSFWLLNFLCWSGFQQHWYLE